jgi:hypothetical protein
MNELKRRRKELGISLDELAAALGPGFCRARLSTAERNLIRLSPAEHEIVLAAIERLGRIRSQVQRILETAQSLDLCADIRRRAASLRASV